ncbi:hypothetical protein V8F20_002503 [Naviculisporaceae sp. PSN 640]
MKFTALAVLATAQLATAHYGLLYPEWRFDTLSGDERYSQWEYPCAGVPGNTGNRTEWPLTGGSLKLELHHAWTYVFVNLGLGENVTVFNYTLTPQLFNTTGNGTFCLPELPLPANLTPKDGDQASLQVITTDYKGTALYNCADIVFRASAKALSGDDCKSNNVTGGVVAAATQGSDDDADSKNETNTDTKGSGAPAGGVNTMVLSSVAGLAIAFVYGLGL